MTRQEHLISIAAEEAVEVAQRATKALRFGLYEVQPGQEKSNLIRMMEEYCELAAAISMLLAGRVGAVVDFDKLVALKTEKVEKFLRYSEHCGTLEKVGE